MNKREKQEQKLFDEVHKKWGSEKAKKEGKKFMTTPENEEKISDNISKYAGPLFATFYEYPGDFESILNAAILLWNFSLYEYLDPNNEERAEAENELIQAFGHEPFLLDPAETMNLVSTMEKYWREEFKHDLRIVVDYKIFRGDQGFHFSIIAEDMSPVAENMQGD